jgi:hypothetical protein
MHFNPRIALGAVGTVIVLALIVARCTYVPKTVMLPTGPQTLTGTLLQSELSLKHRGTHVLLQGDNKRVYVESTVVNLRPFEQLEVTLKGTFVANTNPSDPPVLVVTDAKPIEPPAADAAIPSLGLTVRSPLAWSPRLFDDGVRFTMTGTTTVVLTIAKSSLSSLPPGTAMQVGGASAVRVHDTSGSDVVYVRSGRQILTFTFTPPATKAADAEKLFVFLLRTVTFNGVSSSRGTGSGGVTTYSGSTTSLGGTPCGGPAGILCPSGSFCMVTDNVSDIGVCVKLQH